MDGEIPEEYVASAAEHAKRDHHLSYFDRHGRTFDSHVEPGTAAYDRGVKLHDAAEPELKHCFTNCALATAARSDSSGVRYCEGYASLSGLPSLAHAWLTVEGAVVELTAPQRRATVVPPEGARYYGIPFDDDEAIQAAALGDTRPPYTPILFDEAAPEGLS